MKQILKDLHRRGIRDIRITWRAGGDDGGIESFKTFPETLALTETIRDDLQEIVWYALGDKMNVYCDGDHENTGEMVIKLFEDGNYKCSAENDYEWYEYRDSLNDEYEEDERIVHHKKQIEADMNLDDY